MDKRALYEIVAMNLDYFMSRPGSLCQNANQLSQRTGIAPNTVHNILHPHRRASKQDGSTGTSTIDTLEKLAKALGCEAWELLHPNIQLSKQEREMYEKIEENFRKISQTT